MGSKVSFKSGKDYFDLVKADITKVPTAKPKIAAALEQFDLYRWPLMFERLWQKYFSLKLFLGLSNGQPLRRSKNSFCGKYCSEKFLTLTVIGTGRGVIKHFGRHPEHEQLMELVYDEQLPENIFESIELILFNIQSKDSLRIKPQIKEIAPRRYNVRFDDTIRKAQREEQFNTKLAYYFVIHLSHQSLEKLAHFKQYDCTLPWIYPCFIRTDVYSGEIEKIFRDPAHGEIPDFDSYEGVE